MVPYSIQQAINQINNDDFVRKASSTIRFSWDQVCTMDAFKCCICQDLKSAPYKFVDCRHSLCGYCMVGYLEQCAHNECPECREEIKNPPQLDTELDIEIVVSSGCAHDSPEKKEWNERRNSFFCDNHTQSRLRALPYCGESRHDSNEALSMQVIPISHVQVAYFVGAIILGYCGVSIFWKSVRQCV